MANTLASSWNAQRLVDYARCFSWTAPALGVAGYSDEPAVSFLDDIVKKIMAKANPWKWNLKQAAPFYTQPYQQDYPTSISQNAMGWLSTATMIDINNSTAQPPINCVARLLPTSQCGYPQKVAWIANSQAILGVWPGPGILYVNPLISQGGGPSNNPLTAIADNNGNIQVVTQFGATGANPPSWPAADAPAGTQTTDGGVIWTVQDPNGVAFRVDQLATFNSNVWQIKVVYQLKPPNITSLTQTIDPIPDDLSYLVKQGFLAYCYKQVDNEKFQVEFAQWVADIAEAMEASDREYQEFGFSPQQSITGGGPSVGGYGYPGWQGWQSDGN